MKTLVGDVAGGDLIGNHRAVESLIVFPTGGAGLARS